jgi:hypothetical protein
MANGHSQIYLVATGRTDVTVTLPAAASWTAGLLTVQRTTGGRRVVLQSQNGELVDGARNPVTLDDRYDSFTLATDGNEWVVLFRRQ